MRRFLAPTIALLTIVGAVTACSSSSSSTPSSDAAITGGVTIPLSGGHSRSDVRAVIDTEIGGSTQSLLFDTGSVGISVLSTAVPSAIAAMTGPSFQEPFDGGVVLGGSIISTPVTMSGQITNGPIQLRLVTSASCDSQTPDCAAKDGMSAFSKSIGADGIFGAGLWADGTVFSPLLQLPSGTTNAIAIHWNGDSGWVTIGGSVSASASATLQMPAASPANLPNGAPAWSNQAVPICWQIGEAVQTCAPTVLDTGASALSFPIDFPGGPTSNVKELPSGRTIIAAASAGAMPFLTFRTGRELGTDLATVIPGQSSVDSGIQFFREFVVILDPTDGSVELLAA